MTYEDEMESQKGDVILKTLFQHALTTLENKEQLDIMLVGGLVERLQDYCDKQYEHPLTHSQEAVVCSMCGCFVRPL